MVLPVPAFAQKPPAKVEIIVEDDEQEDFFDEKPNSEEDVRKRADGLVEEIETQEGVKIQNDA